MSNWFISIFGTASYARLIYKALENLEMDEETRSRSDENSSESSGEDEDKSGGEETTKEETWTLPGQVKRKVSERMLIRVGLNFYAHLFINSST